MTFLLEHFKEGGWGMWPILALLIFTLYLIVERTRYLHSCKIEHRRFAAIMRRLLMQGNVAGAVRACRETDKPLSRIVEAGLRKLEEPDEDIQTAVDAIAMHEFPKIEKNTGYLALLGNVATLMGLLGTITGLIRSFSAVGVGTEAAKAAAQAAKAAGGAAAAGLSKAEMLAQGISEAMNCTAFGLMVGILALLAYSVLNGRTQSILDDTNENAVQVLNLAVGHKQAMNLDGVKEIPAVAIYPSA